jgi:hypothetical protein
MIRDPNIFRSGNAPIHKHGHDVAPEAPSTLNVRFGSKADTQCPLLTQSGRSRVRGSMSAYSHKRTFGETRLN